MNRAARFGSTLMHKIPPDLLDCDFLQTDLPENDRLYAQMRLIRTFEETLLALFAANELSGTTHTSIGQESNAVGILNNIDRAVDTVWSNHRCHGHFLAYSGQAEKLFAEIMGRTTGVCAGRGGSQHVCWHRFHTNGIQGGIIPLGLGTAMAGKEQSAITVIFLGDGTLGQGVLYECLNIASLWSLPVLFVVEDNGIAQTTPKHLAVAGNICRRAEAFGIDTLCTDSTDVLDIYTAAGQIIDRIRGSQRPFFWHLESMRLAAHSKGDDTRDPAEIERYRANDPLMVHRQRISNAQEIDTKCEQLIKTALNAAQHAPINTGL